MGESKSERSALVSPLSPVSKAYDFASLAVCVNYANANKSIQMSNGEIACVFTPLSLASTCAPNAESYRSAAYVAATVASCSIAVGLSQLVPRLRVSPSAKALLGKLVPFAAVASAGCVNIGLMRWKEMRDGKISLSFVFGESVFLLKLTNASSTCMTAGISVYAPSDPQTGRPSSQELGKSSIAGTYAVGQTAASRVLTNMYAVLPAPSAISY